MVPRSTTRRLPLYFASQGTKGRPSVKQKLPRKKRFNNNVVTSPSTPELKTRTKEPGARTKGKRDTSEVPRLFDTCVRKLQVFWMFENCRRCLRCATESFPQVLRAFACFGQCHILLGSPGVGRSAPSSVAACPASADATPCASAALVLKNSKAAKHIQTQLYTKNTKHL